MQKLPGRAGRQRTLFQVFRTDQWINDDCSVKACSDGYIPTEDGIYRCPNCNRSVNNPTIPIYDESFLPTFSQSEMEARKEDRRKVVFDREYRLSRGKKMLKEIIEVFKEGNGNGNGKGKKKKAEETREGSTGFFFEEEEPPF